MTDRIDTRTESKQLGSVWPRLRHWLTLAAPGIVLLCFWQYASGRLIRETYISKPSEIGKRLFELFSSGEIWPSLAVTGQELVLSYVIGVTVGILVGYSLGRAPRVAVIVEPYVMAL